MEIKKCLYQVYSFQNQDVYLVCVVQVWFYILVTFSKGKDRDQDIFYCQPFTSKKRKRCQARPNRVPESLDAVI